VDPAGRRTLEFLGFSGLPQSTKVQTGSLPVQLPEVVHLRVMTRTIFSLEEDEADDKGPGNVVSWETREKGGKRE